MNKQISSANNDFSTLFEDARILMAATADVAGEKVGLARQRISAAMDNGKMISGRVKGKMVAGAKATDQALHEHPYQAIGIAFGIGALLGGLVLHRWFRSDD